MKKLLCLCLFLLVLMLVGGCGMKVTADHESKAGSGMKLQMNAITFTADKAEKLREVKPANPNGYYNYYEEQEGYTYFVVTGKAENKGSMAFDTDNILVRGTRGNIEYKGKLLFSNTEESDLVNKMEKDAEQTFYFILLVKDGQEPPDTIEVFYNDDFGKSQKAEHYDYSVRWPLDSLDLE